MEEPSLPQGALDQSIAPPPTPLSQPTPQGLEGMLNKLQSKVKRI